MTSNSPTRRLFLSSLFVLAASLPMFGIEFGILGTVGNMQFPWDQTSLGTGSFSDKNYIIGGKAFFAFPLSEEADLRLSYERDPVLRNLATVSVEFERGIAKIAVGPFFGAFNSSSSAFNVGLSTSIRFQWPGVAFASVRSDGAIALGPIAGETIDPQTRAELALGFYARNSIVSAVVSTSQFTESVASQLVVDSFSSYMLHLDLFKKNVPYTILAEAGYQIRSKSYSASTDPEVLGSVIMGFATSIQPIRGLEIELGIEGAVFSFGSKALLNRSPSTDAVLFSGKFGISFNTEELPRRRGPGKR